MYKKISIYGLTLSLLLSLPLFASKPGDQVDTEINNALSQSDDPDEIALQEVPPDITMTIEEEAEHDKSPSFWSCLSYDDDTDDEEYEYEYEYESDDENPRPTREPLATNEIDPIVQAELAGVTSNSTDSDDDDFLLAARPRAHHVSSQQQNNESDCKPGHCCFASLICGGVGALIIYAVTSVGAPPNYEYTHPTPTPPPGFAPCNNGKNVCDYLRSQNGTLPQGRLYIPYKCGCNKEHFRRQDCDLPGDPNVSSPANISDPEFTLSLRRHNNFTVCDPIPEMMASNMTELLNLTSTPQPTSTPYDDMPELLEMTSDN